MKRFASCCLLVSLLVLIVGCGPDQEIADNGEIIVEASCGECQFGMDGNGCDLAVRIDGQSYYVDGTTLDEHGDAHADDGLCNAIRQARVQGKIENGRFVADSFELLPSSK